MHLYNFSSKREDFTMCSIKYFDGNYATVYKQTSKAWSERFVSGMPYNKFYYNVSGEAIFSINGIEYRMLPGYLYFIPKDTIQTFKLISNKMEQYWLHFDIETSYIEQNTSENVALCVNCDKEKIISLFSDIFEIQGNEKNNVLKKSIKCALLYEYYLECAENSHETESIVVDERRASIMKYIRDNYQNKITAKEIAESLHLNHAYFTRYFKKTFRMTPTEFINKYRADKAALLLKKTDYSMSKIADMCGFESYSYFARIFKKFYQKAPLEYRKKQK